MVFNWSLSDSKFLQVSLILLTILADLNNAVVWMVSSCLFISNSSSPFTNHLLIVPRAAIAIGITVTFMFHSFFNSRTSSRYSFFFLPSFYFTQWSVETAKSTIRQVLFFCWLLQGLVVCPRFGDPFVSQNPRGFCTFRSPDIFWVVHKLFVRTVKFYFLA